MSARIVLFEINFFFYFPPNIPCIGLPIKKKLPLFPYSYLIQTCLHGNVNKNGIQLHSYSSIKTQ